MSTREEVIRGELEKLHQRLAVTQGDMAIQSIESIIGGLEEELAELQAVNAYNNSTYVRKPKHRKDSKPVSTPIPTPKVGNTAMSVRRPLENPSTNAPSRSPFSIASGVRTIQPWLKIFIYGDYGAGKTVLSAQASDVKMMRDVLLINIEGGTQSIAGSGAVKNVDDLDVVPAEGSITSLDQFVQIHKMLLAYCQARDDNNIERLELMAEKYGFDPKKRYKTIILDSLSELNQVSLSRAFGENTDDLLSLADSDDTRRDFGRNKQAMLKIIRAMRNLPMHVIATCGREWDQDERKKLGYQPRLTGALSKEVQAFWDVVGFLQTTSKAADPDEDDGPGSSKVARRLWLQPVGKFDAKNRLSSESVTHIDNPSMGKLVSLLINKEGKDDKSDKDSSSVSAKPKLPLKK